MNVKTTCNGFPILMPWYSICSSSHTLKTSPVFTVCQKVTSINRGSYMSAHVLLNLLNKLGKRDKMRGLPSILSLFRNEFNKFNNTEARM